MKPPNLLFFLAAAAGCLPSTPFPWRVEAQAPVPLSLTALASPHGPPRDTNASATATGAPHRGRRSPWSAVVDNG